MVDLKESRNKIDKIDSSIVELFEERMLVANEVAEYKRGSGKAVFDPERENQKLDSLEDLASTAFNKRAVRELFSQIMSISKKYQYDILRNTDSIKGFECVDKLEYDENTRVCYFGSPGSYTQQAMEEFFGTNVIGISNGTFKEVMEKVQSGEADYGVLPIENSSTGGISTNYDIIINYDNNIVGEHVVKIDQCLMALPGTKMDEIKTIYSHEQGLKQCSQFLANYPQIKQIEYASTSDSAKKVSIDQDKTKAAIGSARAAKEYGLEIIKENIQQETNNSTRFIVISNKDIYKKGSNRIALCIEVKHESGSLYKILSHFMFNDLNMLMIESRPITGQNWRYRFFVDIEGNLEDSGVKCALRGIKEEAQHVRILGNF